MKKIKSKKNIFQKVLDIICYISVFSIVIIFIGSIIIANYHDEISNTIEKKYREKKYCEIVCESKDYVIHNSKCICFDGRKYDLNN